MDLSTTSRRLATRRPAPAPVVAKFAALATLVAFLAAACAPATSPTPEPRATESAAPAATFTGGTATAHLDAPDGASWSGGWCALGDSDAWLAMNIGDLNGAEYFGLVAGADPHGAPDASPAAGGGTFNGTAATVTWRHATKRFVITTESVTVVIAADLHSGTFAGRLADGREARGSFTCP
jgi:hypothetical protein